MSIRERSLRSHWQCGQLPALSSADINSDGDVTGLREPAAGFLPNLPITVGDDGDLGHDFHTMFPLPGSVALIL